MHTRMLGRTGMEIAPVVFGGNVFGWTADERTSFELLDRFVGAGFNAIDTADVYSRWVPGHAGGESETIIGTWLKRGGVARDEVVIITKVGSEMGPDQKGLPMSSAFAHAALCELHPFSNQLILRQHQRQAPPYNLLSVREQLFDKVKAARVGQQRLMFFVFNR